MKKEKRIAWLLTSVLIAFLFTLFFQAVGVQAADTGNATGTTAKTVLAPGPYTRLSDGELIPTSILSAPNSHESGQTDVLQSATYSGWHYWKTTYAGKVLAQGQIPDYIGLIVGFVPYAGGFLSAATFIVNESNQYWNKINKKIIGSYEMRKYYAMPDGDGVNIEYDSYFYSDSSYSNLLCKITTSQVMEHIPLH
ncbi:hypothetical protein [Schleiferilactobacillus shenzhenensis]|uniref:Uncharacterized protein n=1 Tax=Schleiferilactobacillus shenzhenensis LY-73 TaxID=1231336 RepID=U4TU48_9LACO|nr:hypothetical protein [Schleiferilactobacillus shenzhenensis]ERL64962.1 hypothetical protein L248_3124 [Schleiferilactobacillus shenzhenensis LY-73]